MAGAPGFSMDGQLVTAFGDDFLQASQSLQSAFVDWAAIAPKAVEGLGAEAGAEYQAKVVAPLRQRQTEIVDGLRQWSSQLAAWQASTEAADNDVAGGFQGVTPSTTDTA